MWRTAEDLNLYTITGYWQFSKLLPYRLGLAVRVVWVAGFEPAISRTQNESHTAWLHPDIGAGNRIRTGTRLSSHWILSPGRLPIPPFRQVVVDACTYQLYVILCCKRPQKFVYMVGAPGLEPGRFRTVFRERPVYQFHACAHIWFL